MTGRYRLLVGVVAALGLAAAALFDGVSAAGPKDKTETANEQVPSEETIRTFMRGKLDASKTVLDGVVTENFLKIKQGADQMLIMSRASEWNVLQGPVYAQYSNEFRRSVERLIKEADDKDIDGAGLAYMQVTMNCVSCHKYVKGTQVAKAGGSLHRQLAGRTE